MYRFEMDIQGSCLMRLIFSFKARLLTAYWHGRYVGVADALTAYYMPFELIFAVWIIIIETRF